jgi:hypothetical protein
MIWFYNYFIKLLLLLNKQFKVCIFNVSFHRNYIIHFVGFNETLMDMKSTCPLCLGKIIDLCIKTLIIVCFDLQMICHNIWGFAKSTSKLSLRKKKTMWTNEHLITWDFQNAIWTCTIASCTTSTFDTLVRCNECCRFTFSTSKIRRWAYEGQLMHFHQLCP